MSLSIDIVLQKPKTWRVSTYLPSSDCCKCRIFSGYQFLPWSVRVYLFLSLNPVQITLNKVLLVGTKTSTYIGKPVVANAKSKYDYISRRILLWFSDSTHQGSSLCRHWIRRWLFSSTRRRKTTEETLATDRFLHLLHVYHPILCCKWLNALSLRVLQPITRIRITSITGYQDSPFVTLE